MTQLTRGFLKFRIVLVIFLCMVFSLNAINRPVYKIVLTQKGYAQFLQYDVVTPPLREFTFCTWIRVYDLNNDQTIFTYVANGNTRVVRLWLESGGQYMLVSINGKTTSNARVDIVKDVWRHVCLSYQSDYGAWALYIDSKLISCASAHTLFGFVLPGGGSVIIGYGTASNGESNGFEGEIFGANMILSSTIERNYTLKLDPLYVQKRFPRNKLKKDSQDTNYVILSNLLNKDVQNSFETNERNPRAKNVIKYQTPHSFSKHGLNIEDPTSEASLAKNTSTLNTIFEFSTPGFMTTNQDKLDFWNTPKFTFSDLYKGQITRVSAAELLNSDTKNTPSISEFETPPPLPEMSPRPSSFYFDETFGLTDPTPTKSFYNSNNSSHSQHKLSPIETPPPEDTGMKIYGQWTSPKFASTVLNYLKDRINFKPREQFMKKTPQTIPLHKLSDSYPYPSEFKLGIIRPPSQFMRRKLVEKKFEIIRRDPQINVQIIDDDSKSNILEKHAEIHPVKVEITSRGAVEKRRVNRFLRSTLDDDKTTKNQSYSVEEFHFKEEALNEVKKNNHKYFSQPINLFELRPTVKPFSNSIKHTIHNFHNSESQTPPDLEISKDSPGKSLVNRNKWHNAVTYTGDYTPRKFNTDYSDETKEQTQLHPSVKLKYRHTPYKEKYIPDEDELPILNGRKLASEVSHQSNSNKDEISILKYIHGYLPNQNYRKHRPSKREMETRNFDKHVKIGNALNERDVIGVDEAQKEKSFVGGNENVPDIIKYRSELDNENTNVPSSLSPRVCKNVEFYDRVLFVQHDESIDMTHILTPFREKNVAIEFVLQNYKKCSLRDSSFQKNAMLLIDWSKTPVRLFGGAFPRTTTDLCGFF